MIDFSSVRFSETENDSEAKINALFAMNAEAKLCKFDLQCNDPGKLIRYAKFRLTLELWNKAYGDAEKELYALKRWVALNADRTVLVGQLDEVFAPLEKMLTPPKPAVHEGHVRIEYSGKWETA